MLPGEARGFDNTAKLWELSNDTLTARRTFTGHDDAVHGLAISPDGQMLATASYDGRVGLFSVADDTEPRFFPAHQGRVFSVTFDPNGTGLLSAGYEDKTTRLWGLTTDPPRLVREFPKASDNILWASLSPDGSTVVQVGRNSNVAVFSTADGKLLHQLVGHEQTAYRATFSPDGRQLATGSWDSTVRLWDLEAGRQLSSIALPSRKAPPAPLWDFDFRCTPTGCWMAVPLTRGKLAVYDLGAYAEQ